MFTETHAAGEEPASVFPCCGDSLCQAARTKRVRTVSCLQGFVLCQGTWHQICTQTNTRLLLSGDFCVSVVNNDNFWFQPFYISLFQCLYLGINYADLLVSIIIRFCFSHLVEREHVLPNLDDYTPGEVVWRSSFITMLLFVFSFCLNCSTCVCMVFVWYEISTTFLRLPHTLK